MSHATRPKVLLVGWDAADWKVIHPLMDAGKMPTLGRLVEGGTMANLATLHPVLSPMLWTSIATGKRPFKHGIHGFSEPAPDGTGILPITNLSRQTKAIWNILSQNELRSNVVGWWPSHPAEPIRGVMVSNHFQQAVGPPEQPWPTPAGAVHPARLTETLARLRLNPNELLAEHILPFVPRAAEIDQEKDRRLASCAKTLAECTSVHAVATWLMQNEPWDFMAVYYDSIDHFCHGFMRYHPPRQEHIREEDFELYHGVVEAGYRYHDMMLHTLLALAGPETTVILMSDHGFHPDHLRPKALPAEPAGPALEHRDLGIFVMHGPPIKRDTLLHGLSLLDVTPTLLTLFGLPVGEDMDGHPVVDAFVEPPTIETIASWDEVDGAAGQHPVGTQLDPVESQEVIEQLVALGYIEPAGRDREEAVRRTVRELRYNLARAYMDDNRHGQAAEILEELYATWPDEHRFGVQLAMCYQALERRADLRSVVEDLSTRRKADADEARRELREFVRTMRERNPKSAAGEDADASLPATKANTATDGQTDQQLPKLSREERLRYRDLRARSYYNPQAIDYLWGCVCLAEGDYEQALEHLLKSEQFDAQRPGLHLQIGEAYLKLRRPRDAMRSFTQAADVDPENPHAQLGICRCHLRLRDNRAAVERALRTIGLMYQYPLAHYCLGVALDRMGRVLQAVEALHVAVSINPNFAEAHRRLALIYRNRLGEYERAEEHRRLAIEMRAARKAALAAKRKYRPPLIAPTPAETQAPGRTGPLRSQAAVQTAATGEPTSTSDRDVEPITIVSGLPRSGTSMVMQMLAAGGMPLVVDEHRAADESNPRGYFEYQPVKRLQSDNSWLAAARGKALKVIVQLLPHLMPEFRYRVLYIDRDIEEVLDSQARMLEREGRAGARLSREQLRRTFQTHASRIRQWLAREPQIELLTLNHRQIVQQPDAAAHEINDFLGGDLDAERMAAVVDPKLHRQKR